MIYNNYEFVDMFEKKVAKYAGSKYAIAVDSCSNALFLCLKYLKAEGVITIPSRTYLSVPMQIIHAGCEVEFKPYSWTGAYHLDPYPIVDAAQMFTNNMYEKNTYYCLSFQASKILKIGKGGMILTNDKKSVQWFRRMSFDGRDRNKMVNKDKIDMIGYHMNMIPDDAVKGLLLMNNLSKYNEPNGGNLTYRDLSKMEVFEK
jgi:dTDP-4-amino-4,6-dideoxygalactose transaminase